MRVSSSAKITVEDQLSVYSLLADAAARAPQATAITFLPSMESEPVRLTHDAFLSRLHRMARLFRGLGVNARRCRNPARAQYSRCCGRALGR
jgi:acyl-CoA synthetase (AMP-forming)/AMP-acid ligase II